MHTYYYARAALWDTAIKFSLQSRAMTSPDHLEEPKTSASAVTCSDEIQQKNLKRLLI